MTSANAEKEDAEPEKDAQPEKYQLTDADRAATDRLLRIKDGLEVRIKLTDDGHSWTVDHPDIMVGHARLMQALATTDDDFAHGIIRQLIRALYQDGQVDESELGFMFGILKGVAPQNPVETMLAAQIAAVYMATMTLATRLTRAEGDELDRAERAVNKLARTFTAQLEALRRLRSGGVQSVTVQNVSVSEGGQAIVGTVNQAARDPAADKAADMAATAAQPLTPSDTAPMPIVKDRDDAKAPVAVAAERKQKP